MKSDTRGLANEAYLSNPIASEAIAQWFKNYKLNWTAVHIAFQNIVHGSIFIEKQTAVHIAFQNTVHDIFLEKNRLLCI